MAGKNESVGNVEMGIEIDFDRLADDTKKLGKFLDQLDPATKKALKGFQDVENAGNKAADGVKKVSVASQALSVALGVLGVQSITTVVMKVKQFITESLQLGIALDGVQARAKALFQEALPGVTKEIDAIAAASKRSDSSLLDMATGFGLLLDSVGATQRQVATFSVELSKLSIALGKAFPDKSDADIAAKLQAGILGNVRGLRELGIVMKDNLLQDFAKRKEIKLKLKDMTDEQKVMLRTMFLLEETDKLQQAAAQSTGELGDEAKTAKDKWQDLKEETGQGLGPAFTVALKGAIGLAQTLVDVLVLGGQMIRDMAVALSSRGSVTPEDIDRLTEAKKLQLQNDAALNAAVQRRRVTGSGKRQSEDESDFWNFKGTGSDGKDADKLAEDIRNAEEEIAKARKQLLSDTREQLMLKKELGVLTKSEEKLLGTINRRTEFNKDMVDEATDAWKEQVEQLKDVDAKIKDINERIADERASLNQKLLDIDSDLAKSRIDLVRETIEEMNKIQEKGRSSSLSGDESRRMGELREKLTNFSEAEVMEGGRLAGLNDVQKLEEDRRVAREEAQAASDAKILQLQKELSEEQKNRDQIVSMEQQKKQAVIDALLQRSTVTLTTYKLLENETKKHVDTQIEQFNRLKQAINALTSSSSSSVSAAETGVRGSLRFAGGGPVYGPGGPKDDKIAAFLSNGEYVIQASAARMYRPLIERINSMTLDIPRFASGGPVTNSSTKNSNITVNNFGEAASVAADPVMIRWWARKAA